MSGEQRALRDGMAGLGFIVGRNPDGVDDSVEATLLTVRELKEMAERTERAEAAARDFADVLAHIADDDPCYRDVCRRILARHPDFGSGT